MVSIAKRPDGKWRARYRDGAGVQHARHFTLKRDAQRWLDEVTTSVITGRYVAPRSGQISLRDYAEQWRSVQVHRPSTSEQVERHFRNHIYPALGDRSLDSIRTSDVQALVKRLSSTLAPSTIKVIYTYLSCVFKAAVTDRLLAESPCVRIKLPAVGTQQVVPMTVAQVSLLSLAFPTRYQAMITLAAGTGMRQGEVFGLTASRIDFNERTVRVDRQLVSLSGRKPTFGPVKTPASNRVIPLPQVVVDALSEHLEMYPSTGLVFTNVHGDALRRSNFGEVWRKASEVSGVQGYTFHSLRHFYASLLIRHGESVKTVQARLGHESASETLDTYSHLWPDSDDRTRAAVDSVLRRGDSLGTDIGDGGVIPLVRALRADESAGTPGSVVTVRSLRSPH